MRVQQTVFFLCVSCLMFACQPQDSSVSFLPRTASEKKWRRERTIARYTPENLYEYVNGEAELYHLYGFRDLVSASYILDGDDSHSMTVDIYRMKDALNAFGLYSCYRASEYQYLPIGNEGYRTESEILFFKDAYVVEIRAGDSAPETAEAMYEAALLIDQKIPSAPLPGMLSLLPSEHQKEHTLRYIPTAMLNQSFLPEGLEAVYLMGQEMTGFIVLFKDDQEAGRGFRELLGFYGPSGDADDREAGRSPFVRIDTALNDQLLLMHQNHIILGVRGCTNAEIGKKLLFAMQSHLQK